MIITKTLRIFLKTSDIKGPKYKNYNFVNSSSAIEHYINISFDSNGTWMKKEMPAIELKEKYII